MVTDRIHRPYKTIYSQFVKSKKSNLSGHIQVSNNIQTFLVKKRYGVIYQQFGMSLGLVSMSAFLKVGLIWLSPFSNQFFFSLFFSTLRWSFSVTTFMPHESKNEFCLWNLLIWTLKKCVLLLILLVINVSRTLN